MSEETITQSSPEVVAPVENNTTEVLETPVAENTTEITETPSTPAPASRYNQYQELIKKFETDINYKPTAEDEDLIIDYRNGLIKEDDTLETPKESEVVEGEVAPEYATMTALDTEIQDVMNKMGVEKFEELPKKIKEVFMGQAEAIQAKEAEIAKYVESEKSIEPTFRAMESLMIGLYNGDQTAKAQMEAILKQRNIDPKSVVKPAGVAGDLNPDDFLDPDMYKAVTGKISKLEESVNEFLRTKQEEQARQAEVQAQETARNQVVDEFVQLAEKYPSFNMKPAQVRESINTYFKTGVVPTGMQPFFDLVKFTDELSSKRGYPINLEDAYKLREFENLPNKIADEVKKAKTALVKQKPSQGTTLAAAQNRSNQGLGGTTHTHASLQEMAKNSNYPDAWKSGMALDINKIPKADLEVLQTIWNAQKGRGMGGY